MNLSEKIICVIVNGVIFSVGVSATYTLTSKVFEFLDWVHGIKYEPNSKEQGDDYSFSYGSDDEDALICSLKRSLQTSKQISKNYREQGISLKKENQSLKHLVKTRSNVKKENKSLKEENQHVKRVLSFQRDLLREQNETIQNLEIKLEEEKKLHAEKKSSNYLKKGYDFLLDGLSQEVFIPERTFY